MHLISKKQTRWVCIVRYFKVDVCRSGDSDVYTLVEDRELNLGLS